MVLYENLSKCDWCGHTFSKGDKVIVEMIAEVEYKGDPNIDFPLDVIKATAYHNDTRKSQWTCYRHHKA